MKLHYKTIEALKKRDINLSGYKKKVIEVREKAFFTGDVFEASDLEPGVMYELEEEKGYYGETYPVVVFTKSREETDQELASRIIKEHDEKVSRHSKSTNN